MLSVFYPLAHTLELWSNFGNISLVVGLLYKRNVLLEEADENDCAAAMTAGQIWSKDIIIIDVIPIE